MLRATSEMAVAMSVRSLPAKPAADASSRPFCRAATMSTSPLTMMRASSITDSDLAPRHRQQVEPLLEVERGRDVSEREAELDHGHRHLWLDADDDGARAAQLRRL